MALPGSVRVKLSSEDAGAISLTAVVLQEMPVRELVEVILASAGKDVARIRDVLRRGSFISGASRFRWEGWMIEEEELRALLATFPDPDPGRVFVPGNCIRAVVRGARQQQWEIARGAGCWEALMKLASAGEPRYAGYSYKHRADRFDLPLAARHAEELRAHPALRRQFAAAQLLSLELYAAR